MRVHCRLPGQCLVEKLALAGRLEQRQRGADHGGEIRRQPRKQQLPGAPRMAEPVALGHRCGDEVEGAARHRNPRRLAEHDAGVDQRRDHQAVPVGQNLVVEAGPHAAGAGFEQRRPQRRQPRLVGLAARHVLEPVEYRVTFEIAFIADIVVTGEELAVVGAEPVDNLALAPDVELAFLTLQVGIERCREGAFRRGHLARQPSHRLARARGEQRRAGTLESQRQQLEQLRIVVEHLLEVRHQPALVDRIAREAAAEMIVDAALAHALKRMLHRFEEPDVAAAHAGAPQHFQESTAAGISARRAGRHAPCRRRCRSAWRRCPTRRCRT